MARGLSLAALCLALCAALPARAASPAHADAPLEAVEPVPRYLLQDVRGRVVTQDSFRGRFQLIAFGFVSCPDVCPTTLAGVRDILDVLGARAERIQALFVTVDPERDTPAVLREYTAAFHPAILGLHGDADRLRRAADSFRVGYAKVREPGAAPDVYTMDHSTGLFLLDGDGRFVTRFASTLPPAEVAARLAPLIDAMPAPARKGPAPLR